MQFQYSKLIDEPKKLSDPDAVRAGEFLWNNFWFDFDYKREGISRLLIETHLKRLLYNQGVENIETNLCKFMKDDEVILHATELYAYIQLTTDGIQNEYWAKALKQANPYVLRYEVFAVHNRMVDLMKPKNVKPGDKEWEALRAKTYMEAMSTLEHIKGLVEKYPAFSHFLMGYSHYTLAMGATNEHAEKHWKSAYKHFLMAEATEKQHPIATFIVNLGPKVFKDMPYENLEVVKSQITENLSEEAKSEAKEFVSKKLKI